MMEVGSDSALSGSAQRCGRVTHGRSHVSSEFEQSCQRLLLSYLHHCQCELRPRRLVNPLQRFIACYE